VQPQTRKVGAVIPIEEHTQLKILASKHGTTIESLLQFGLKLVYQKLKTDKTAAARLTRDRRL
jgi:hypothetical protein